MFGQNKSERPVHHVTDGTTLRVVAGSPWYTIQGEGPFAGRPAVFLRLHGCNLRCFFCDTEFDQPTNPTMAVMDIVNAVEAAAPGHCRLLVITGGEPVRQNLSVLVRLMTRDGWTVQVETAGTLWQECLLDTVIVCSPKLGMIHSKIYKHAHAFKYVVATENMSVGDGLPCQSTQQENGGFVRIARPRPGADVYLSPMDEGDPEANTRNANLVAKMAMEFGYRAGLQMHKYMGVE